MRGGRALAGRTGEEPPFNDKWSKGMPQSKLRLSLQAKIFLDKLDPGYHIIPINKEYPEEFYHKISEEKTVRGKISLPPPASGNWRVMAEEPGQEVYGLP